MINRTNHRMTSVILCGLASLAISAMSLAGQTQSANAQTTATASAEQAPGVLKPVVVKPAAHKPAAPKIASAAPGSTDTVSAPSEEGAKVRKPSANRSSARGPYSAVKGPYYVDFRARTAASYGHAFVWFGKSTDKKVDVAGLHPAGDEVPFILGHVIPVPAETGASYGDLDPEYLTANYKVYMSEADAKRVFAYIRKLQATTKFWNETTSSCTTFMGQIASFMGLKTPFYLQKPEEYVNQLKEQNDGKSFIQLPPEVSSLEQ